MSSGLPRRVLVANRGEIAIRVTRTCHAAGVEVVAVHVPAENAAPHILDADLVVEIPSYMDVDALLAAAARTNCDAVHPGYGFLSENAPFARAVADAGLTWIGPPPAAMETMGSKARARSKMKEAGVPVVPGSEPGDADALAAAATEIGYPVLLKAVAGGGGKGMSAVTDAKDLPRAFRMASEEAARSFGDGTMYVEKLLERPRHIEIQVFADSHGNTVALGERECSIQRRHQKIVEESPSPALDADLRARMSAAAVAAAEAVAYEGAGTIEFLLGQDGEFYFLEMNTRLQVEHPVTEWVTGLDLVRLQLEVAAGAALPPEALQPTFLGHSIECRIYAEDPANGFLPQAGRLLLVREPGGPGIRIDSALAEGQEVTADFDPMLAKVSTWGRDRSAAIARMREALQRFVVLGIHTNIEHLQDVIAHPAFAAGELSTAFLNEHLPAWSAPAEPDPMAIAAIALAERFGTGRASADRGAGSRTVADPWDTIGGFRIGGTS